MRAHAAQRPLLAAFLTLLFRFTNTQDACLTPHGQPGACADLKLCPHLLDKLLYNRTKSSDQYLRNSLCERPHNYNVKVCCDRPACATSGGLPGTCARAPLCHETATGGVPARGTCGAGLVCCPRNSLDGYVSRQTGLPEFGFCGVTESKSKGGSKIVSPVEHPWTALLVYRGDKQEVDRCGGTLIGARFVITAAHCIMPELVKVRLGVSNITERCGAGGGADCPFEAAVANVTVPPFYDAITGADDLAVITLAKPVPYTKHTRPACLPSRELGDVHTSELFTVGWGVSPELSGAQLDRDALPVRSDLPLRSLHLCRRAIQTWADLLKPHVRVEIGVPEGSVCAGGTFRGELCGQDSGGGLAWSGRGGTVVLAVHNRSPAGCRAPVPAVYTPLAPHSSWIVGVMTDYYKDSGLRNRLVL